MTLLEKLFVIIGTSVILFPVAVVVVVNIMDVAYSYFDDRWVIRKEMMMGGQMKIIKRRRKECYLQKKREN